MEFDLVDVWSIFVRLSGPISILIICPLSNFGFFFADPDESLVLFGSRNERRFCWRTEARRLPVAVAGGDVNMFKEGAIRSSRRDDDGGCRNGWWETEELSIVSSLTWNGYWCGCSRLEKIKIRNEWDRRGKTYISDMDDGISSICSVLIVDVESI